MAHFYETGVTSRRGLDTGIFKKKGTESVLGPHPLGLKTWLRNERPISNAVRRRGPAHRYLNHRISLFMAVLWIACFWGLQLEDGTDGEGPVWSDLAVGKAPSIQSWYQEHCRCPHTLSVRNCGLEMHRIEWTFKSSHLCMFLRARPPRGRAITPIPVITIS